MTNWFEANFDGLIGPTHNYAGLSFGNQASSTNSGAVSNPRQAALQGLEKMAHLNSLGLIQGILPPHERPHFSFLRQIGFTGSEADIIEKVAQTAPELLATAYSASPMWCANAATITAGPESLDGKTHFTPANLSSLIHRSIETQFTGEVLQHIFKDETHFHHHPALPCLSQFGDEGAANHTRLSADYDQSGVSLFVYGQEALNKASPRPRHFPARQSKEASQAIARQHGIKENRAIFLQQNPEVIDYGVFHNDVIAVGNKNVLLYHERAFLSPDESFHKIEDALGCELVRIMVPDADVTVQQAVRSYLFNSQLISLPDGGMSLIAPKECEETEAVRKWADKVLQTSSVLKNITYLDVRESMRNGGGPACLRLRVPLNDQSLDSLSDKILFTKPRHKELRNWVKKHYRDQLAPDDLRDPALVTETRTALDHLTQILGLGSIYPFQKEAY